MKILKSTAFALAVILAAGNFPGFCGTEIYTEKFCSAAGISENISEEGLVYTETDGEIHITGIIENIQSVVIPDKIDNKPIIAYNEDEGIEFEYDNYIKACEELECDKYYVKRSLLNKKTNIYSTSKVLNVKIYFKLK